MDYKELYFELYGELSNLIDQLTALQQKYENKYIESEEEQHNDDSQIIDTCSSSADLLSKCSQ